MKKQSLLLSAALMCSAGMVAQMTTLLPDGVKAILSQTKHFDEQKNLCVAGSPEKGYKAFFQATDTEHGEELWVTDGTPEGTRMVKDINPGMNTSNVQYLTRFNDKVVFSATDGEDNGQELWISDGTEDGTYMVKDIHDFGSSNPIGFRQLDENRFVFYATTFDSENYRTEPQQWLWVSDGTGEGTNLVKEVDCKYPGQEENDNRWGANARVGRKVFFKAEEADKDGVTHGVELWVTDGTTEGTFLVKDINLEVADGKPEGSTNGPALAHMKNFYNEKLFFKAWDEEHGNEPWASDGTAEGTYNIFDTNPNKDEKGIGIGGGVTCVGDLYNGEVIFRGNDGIHGCELGVSTCEPGNFRLFDINVNEPTQDNQSFPDPGVVLDNVYIFCANNGLIKGKEDNYGGELWCYDGNKVWLQYDFAPGLGCNWVKEAIVVGGSMYWWNEGSHDGTGATDTKLHRLDAPDAIPQIVSDIDANGDKVYCLRNFNGDLLFTSSVTNQIYRYHYRKDGYDPKQDEEAMAIEFRTRKEIEEQGALEAITVSDVKLALYPNPAVESFRIDIDVPVKDVRIYNMAGAQVKAVSEPENNVVNVNGLGSGVYMVTVATANATQTAKLIVR